MGYKRGVKDSVRKMLYANSGNVCAMYGCGTKLVSDNTANIAEICHIEAVNENGARYNNNLTDEYVNSYENLILLCPGCHKIIDDKANAELYTVEYLKRMKQIHEDKVREALMQEPVIDPPIYLENYDVSSIVNEYNHIFDTGKEINEEYVYKALKNIISLKIAMRSVVYKMVELSSKEDGLVDIHQLYNVVNNLSWYNYLYILRELERQKVIEVRGINPLDGYEDEYGEWHFGEDNYFYKVNNGEWYLKKKGKVFVAIFSMLGNEQDFYDFMINRKIELLKTIEKK